jgi:hypothetical protein
MDHAILAGLKAFAEDLVIGIQMIISIIVVVHPKHLASHFLSFFKLFSKTVVRGNIGNESIVNSCNISSYIIEGI